MASKSLEQCLMDIFKDIELRKNVDYASKASVRHYNTAGDRIRKNFQYIDKYYPHDIDAVLNLLEHSDPRVVTHCAVAIQDMSSCSNTDKRKGIEKVKQLVVDESVNIPDKVWLSFIWINQAERNLEPGS